MQAAYCVGTQCDFIEAVHTQEKAMQYFTDILHVMRTEHPDAKIGQNLDPSVDVQHCLRRIGESGSSQSKEGLAIVVSVSPDRTSDVELDHTTDNIKQYAEKHGYRFYLQIAQTSKLVHFFSARWLDLVTSDVWRRHKWVLHLDGDSIFLNFNKSLEAYTSMPEDVILQLRLNKEVTAAAVLMRTTPFADCFVRLWGGKGLHARGNWDNGDLLSTLLDFAAPDLASVCERSREENDYNRYVDCFSEAHLRLISLANFMPIRVFPPLAGFWKSLEGTHDADFEQESPELFRLLMRCWSSDVLGHGSKNIGTWGWSTRQDKNSFAPNCLFNTPEEELHLAKKCCLWHFPGLYTDLTLML